MIAVDTNLLVYAHREDSEWHMPAYESVRGLADSSSPWAIPAPCLHEFLAIVTHPRIYRPPTPLTAALDQVDAWLAMPNLHVLAEGPGYWQMLSGAAGRARIAGGQIHDARVAALCMFHGVSELWTADRDFSRYPDLAVRNPLLI